VATALLDGHTQVTPLGVARGQASAEALRKSLSYLRARVGVPRDMTYPAARQLRAHLSWAIDQLDK